ncbi:methyltransferase domain-containing protein [Streptomyces tubbatahanensis]|uniref:Protein-L-isoaspartate O-methyltransferase n=1 Tax=Streptomyces tubbatahanensis TaxID=2923272 RepID=A0ABY3Y3N6_9ACTN|nr:methyltransferase domain-containing protein [Streptomyces tubbatahanensis]UNT01148.1 methyltransferase domain-containing protein [Streptomyces tubbatahanensis]
MVARNPQEPGPEGLASELLGKGALTPDWLPAYRAVPRHVFVPGLLWPGTAGGNRQGALVDRDTAPEQWWEKVYSDIPLTTHWDDGAHARAEKGRSPTSSNSMPTMVFAMLDALAVEPGNRVLEVGTGTGWNAALLAHRLGAENVVTVEVDPAVAAEAQRRFGDLGLTPLSVVGDGVEGHEPGAPYDRVIATCGVSHVPRSWIEQCRPGGLVVAPWGPAYGGQAVARLRVGEDGAASGTFVRASAFMRLRDQRNAFPPTSAYPDTGQWPAGGVRRTSFLSPDALGGWHHMFTLGIQLPDVFCRVSWGSRGAYRLWLLDMGVTSWATADYEHGRSAYDVVQHGPRRLWDEAEEVMAWWREHGGPRFERFGLTVTPLGQRVWLDHPDNPVPVRVP